MRYFFSFIKPPYSSVIRFSLLILYSFLFQQCAQQGFLTGGARDTTPPKLLKAIPEANSLNVTSKTIELSFDEYVTLKDLTNQFVITPQTKEIPEIEAVGKKIIIKFKDDLAINTTYQLSFGDAIVDMHESNPLTEFEYVFSTGSTLDSLKLTGQITDAFTLKPLNNAIVGLYKANQLDSCVYKEKPFYIAKTNASGDYAFNYLHDGDYKVIAFSDENKNMLYDVGTEYIGSLNSALSIKKDTLISLKVFKEVFQKTYVKKTMTSDYGKANIIFNKPYSNYSVTVITTKNYSIQNNKTKDSLTIFYHQVYDTLKCVINYPNQPTDTLTLTIPSKNDVDLKLKNTSNLIATTNFTDGKLPYYAQPTFSYVAMLDSVRINPSHITLSSKTDSLITKQAVQIGFISPNSIVIKNKLKSATDYKIEFQKNTIGTYIQTTNDSAVYTFKTTLKEEYATLHLKLFFPKKEHYVIQLLNEREQVIQEQVTSISLTASSEKVISFTHLKPENYFVRVIEDTNKNGRWDEGSYFDHRLSEVVYFNKTPIKLLADWEIEHEWKIAE